MPCGDAHIPNVQCNGYLKLTTAVPHHGTEVQRAFKGVLFDSVGIGSITRLLASAFYALTCFGDVRDASSFQNCSTRRTTCCAAHREIGWRRLAGCTVLRSSAFGRLAQNKTPVTIAVEVENDLPGTVVFTGTNITDVGTDDVVGLRSWSEQGDRKYDR